MHACLAAAIAAVCLCCSGAGLVDLPYSAQLNALCDALATKQLESQNTTASETSLSIPLAPRTLPVEDCFGTQVISSSHYISRLKDVIGMQTHCRYLQPKLKWADSIWDSIS
jgi:hypothetical protein